MEKSCVICGELFESNYQRKKYCSNDCKREADRRRLRIKWTEDPNCKREKSCQFCGKELPKYKTRFCSNDCRHRYNNVKTGRISHNTELIKTCVVCGKQFTTWHSTYVTCSDECRNKRQYDPEKYRKYYIKSHPDAMTAEERKKKLHEEKLRRIAKQKSERETKKAIRETERARERARREAEKEKQKQANIEYWHHYEAEHTCACCGKQFIAHFPTTKYCSDKCQRRINRKRRRYKGITIDSDISLFKLSERDHDRCQICGQLVDWDDFVKTDKATICGNMYPSIDHIIPISVGGLHSWDNIQLAHRICNTRKNNKVI